MSHLHSPIRHETPLFSGQDLDGAILDSGLHREHPVQCGRHPAIGVHYGCIPRERGYRSGAQRGFARVRLIVDVSVYCETVRFTRDNVLNAGHFQVYTPYFSIAFDIRADGTAARDIEHIVALAEAHDSWIADDRRRDIASDLDNLTVAERTVNRSEKSDRDAAERIPDRHGAWFWARVIAVKKSTS